MGGGGGGGSKRDFSESPGGLDARRIKKKTVNDTLGSYEPRTGT